MNEKVSPYVASEAIRPITSAMLCALSGEDPENPDSVGIAECERLATLLLEAVPENLLAKFVLDTEALLPHEVVEILNTYFEDDELSAEASSSEWVFTRYANALKKLCEEQGVKF